MLFRRGARREAARREGPRRRTARARGGPWLALPAGLLFSCMNATQSTPADAELAREREGMVERQLVARGIRDPRVLDAMRRVPRHELVPPELRERAYDDNALPIGHGQTISQPYVVAAMSEALALRGHERVLEVGTGSGYQAAVLGLLAQRVYSIEIVAALAERARQDLSRLGHENVEVRTGDGYRGWPEEAPFDAIVVTAAPDHVPAPLLEQLARGGRMVIPVGASHGAQELLRLVRTEAGIERERLIGVRFVPMLGEAEGPR